MPECIYIVTCIVAVWRKFIWNSAFLAVPLNVVDDALHVERGEDVIELNENGKTVVDASSPKNAFSSTKEMAEGTFCSECVWMRLLNSQTLSEHFVQTIRCILVWICLTRNDSLIIIAKKDPILPVLGCFRENLLSHCILSTMRVPSNPDTWNKNENVHIVRCLKVQ